jgi:hypothetical protein
MSTLQEIESAIRQLSVPERQQLLLLIAQNLREQGELPPPRSFSAEEIQSWMDEDERDMKEFLGER